jgi:hypothetical protein
VDFAAYAAPQTTSGGVIRTSSRTKVRIVSPLRKSWFRPLYGRNNL